MKLTLACVAAVSLLADAALAFHLPPFLEPRQQQTPPKCSLYSGFEDSSSFTSFCKQRSRATKSPILIVNPSSKKAPSISTQHFTFEGGRTSTVSPVEPVISSAAAGNTYELHNFTMTMTALPSNAQATSSQPSDVEVNCYLNGSKVPMSECTKTAGLTRTHGYTYPYRTSSTAAATSSIKLASSGSISAVSSRQPTATSGSTGSTSKAVPSSTVVSGQLASRNCTRTPNLTRLHGYTYSYGTAPAASTANLTSFGSTGSSATLISSLPSTAKSTTKAFGTGPTSSTSFVDSYDCSNITGVEPYRLKSSNSVRATGAIPSFSGTVMSSSAAEVPSSVTLATSSAKSSTNSAPSSAIESQTTFSAAAATFRSVGHAAKYQRTITTTVIDATVTSVVPCATDVGRPADQKRDILFTAGGPCDAGVYCINSTSISDAPPSWHWDAVPLKHGQACLKDNVFNTEWVELQCACAGL